MAIAGKIKQVSIFMENKMGELTDVTTLLSKNNLSIKSINLAEASDFGLLRVIVDDAAFAKEILDAAGFSVKITEIFAVAIEDHVGSFNEVVRLLSENGINIEYTYTLSNKEEGAFVFKVNPAMISNTLQLLRNSGVKVLDRV